MLLLTLFPSLSLSLSLSLSQRRIGHGARGDRAIKDHAFFKGMDWDKLATKMYKAPFVPKVSDPQDVSNFDPVFTQETARDSIVPECVGR